jgi:hypothetical protein
METKKTVQISFIILLIVIIIALILGIVASFKPELLISRSFPLYTSKPWDDFLTSNPMIGNYILIKERVVGGLGLAACLCGLFVLFNTFRKVVKWTWYCMLVFTMIIWGTVLIESITFKNSLVIFVAVVGLVLAAIGLIISTKAFLLTRRNNENDASSFYFCKTAYNGIPFFLMRDFQYGEMFIPPKFNL